MSEKKKPVVRFDGFTDDWEQRKVTEVGKIYIGLVTTMTNHYTSEGNLLIRNSDIKDGYFEFGENPIYLEKSFAEENYTRMHQVGDVITVHTGDVGTSAVITENEANSIGFATIVTRPNPKIIDSNYLATFLNTEQHKRWAISISTGDGRTNYNLGDYYELVIPVPNIDEQKKIAEYIKSLNTLITLCQRKCDKLKNVKKSMLEKMFPKNGCRVPEIRFAGFTDDWEQRKLGEVVQITMGQSPDGSTYSDVPSDYVLVQGNADLENGWVKPRVWTTQITKQAVVGDLIMSVRAPAGAMGKTAYNTVIGRGVAAIKGNEFIYQLLIKMDKEGYWKKDSTGSTFESLNSESIKNAELKIPSEDEQNRIGKYFENLDNLITLHQRELEKLQNIKKSCLEKMFV